MTKPIKKYVRVYYDVLDDQKFEGIYEDDRCFATWVRLLLTADALWPQPADIPRSAHPKAVSLLVNAGLIDLLPNHRYRVHGLSAERESRGLRRGPGADPDGNPEGARQDA